MRDKKDNATIDLPGFGPPPAAPAVLEQDAEPKRRVRVRKVALKQVQLELLEPTDATGLPVWTRDAGLDLSGLPIWAPDKQA
ncbi:MULTISPECIES: hypothetical protein [unclassified Janthinobacterium]|jgi:hypothetical protein|uniref:hypothetical protein n=1 Tax=unclassified Janthinobacterium TaxID=2610881 RepID=UPI0016228AD0|nr:MULTISPECIES: hypothetical protein [unclassified Janthinobacterium]MBB5610337.1 hypothetical protein [Janthinobacterium sp. S3T4]MBB5615645.1 hypothetical protein [Janthinobacterium sp. S3M3]